MGPFSTRDCLIAVVFFLAVSVAFFVGRDFFPPVRRGAILREKGFQYISPIISCEIAPDKKDFQELKFLEDDIQSVVKKVEKDGRANDTAVYFRALNSGRWVAVNEDALFSPASMLKVATVIAFYREAQVKPEILKKAYVWSGADDKNAVQHIKPEDMLKKSGAYTANDIIRRAVIYSDNNAADLLKKEIDPRHFLEVYTDLQLPFPKNQEDDFMSPKSYSLLFRVLYNATYLDRETSELLSKLLTETGFREGLVRGVPSEITVAHKFGERSVIDGATGKTRPAVELHDCGIVYYPNHPYFLCVMTRGAERTVLASAIADVSKVVYDSMDEFWKTNK